MEGSNTNDSGDEDSNSELSRDLLSQPSSPSPQQPQRQKTGAAPAAPHREKERVNVCDKTHASTIAGMERPSFNSNVAEWNSTAGGRPGPEQDYVRCAEGGQGGVPCSNNMTSKRDLRFFTEHKQYGAKDKSARTRPGSMRHGCKNTSSTSNGKPRKKSSLERKFERRSTQREAAAAKSANDEESSVEFDIINESPPLAPISRQKSPFDTRLIRPSNSRDGARREGKADDAEERDLDSQSEIDPNDPAANDKVDALHNSFDTDSQPSKLKELNQSILADKQAALELLQPPAGKSRQQSHPPDAEDAHIAGKEIQVIPSQVGAMSQIDMYQSQMGGLSQLSTNEDELGDGVTLSQMKLEGTKARLDDDRGNEKTEPAEDQLEVAGQECQNDIDFGGNNDREKLPFEDSRLSSIRPDSSRFELINSDIADGCDHGDLELSRMERGERKCTNSPDRNDPVQPTNVFDGTTGADTTGGQMGLANIKTHDVQAKLMKQYREQNQSKKKEGGARRRPKNNARSAALEAQREVEKEATKEAFKRKLGTTRKQGGLRNATAAALEEFAETRTIGTEPQKVGRKIDVGTSVVPKQDLQCTKRKGGAVKNHDAFDDNAGYSFDLDDGAPHAAVGSLDKHADDVTKRKSKGERQSDIESIEGTAKEQSEPLLSSSLPTSEKSESLLSSAVPFEDSRLSAIPRNSQYSKHSIVEPMVAESGGKAIASGNSEARSSRTNHPVKKASSHSLSGECGGDGDRTDTDGGKQPSGECGGDDDRTDTDGGKQTEPADEDSRRRNEAVLAIHAEIDNLLKVFVCPICQGTLTEPKMLACGHSFCGECLKSQYLASSKKECAVCKAVSGRRAGDLNPQLNELAKAFKRVARAFGRAPAKPNYDGGITYTQVAPGDESCSDDDGNVDAMRIKRESIEEHREVSKSFQDVLTKEELRWKQKKPNGKKEEIERDNQLTKFENMIKEQEKVVMSDEQELTKLKGNSSPEEFLTADDDESEVLHDGKTVKKMAKISQGLELGNGKVTRESTETAVSGGSPIVLHDGKTVRKSRTADALRKPPPEVASEDSDPTPRRSGKMSPLPNVLIAIESAADRGDGNRPTDDRKMPAAAAAATESAGAIGDVEGPTDDRKMPAAAAAIESAADRGDDELPTDDRKMPAAAAAATVSQPLKQGGDELTLKPESSLERSSPQVENTRGNENTIKRGSIVCVQSRTWPGINKPGGVGRVTRVHAANDSNVIKYDIKYILGGSEKNVDACYVTLNDDPLSPVEEEGDPDVSRVTRGSLPGRAGRKRRAPEPSPVQIYNDQPVDQDVLDELPDDILKELGIKKKKSGKSGGKKRALADTNAKSAKAKSAKGASKKKKRKTNVETSDTCVKSASAASPSVDDAGREDSSNSMEDLDGIGHLSTAEIVKLADARYSSLLGVDSKGTDGETLTIHYVTSSLSETDSGRLNSLCKKLKSKNIVLKATKDFQRGKTRLCVTAPSTTAAVGGKGPDGPADCVPRSRTLKVMRSALAGVPVLTPEWVGACLLAGDLVAPTGSMCVRTLPRKQSAAAAGDGEDERFGVARYAAALRGRGSGGDLPADSAPILGGVRVVLCGKSTNLLKDLRALLQQTGASVVGSASSAARALADLVEDRGTAPGSVVFVCDDATNDRDCGISESLARQARDAIDAGGAVRVVRFDWLFDSVSCVSPLPADSYEPSAPRARDLWKVCTGGDAGGVGRSRYESQVY